MFYGALYCCTIAISFQVGMVASMILESVTANLSRTYCNHQITAFFCQNQLLHEVNQKIHFGFRFCLLHVSTYSTTCITAWAELPQVIIFYNFEYHCTNCNLHVKFFVKMHVLLDILQVCTNQKGFAGTFFPFPYFCFVLLQTALETLGLDSTLDKDTSFAETSDLHKIATCFYTVKMFSVISHQNWWQVLCTKSGVSIHNQ